MGDKSFESFSGGWYISCLIIVIIIKTKNLHIKRTYKKYIIFPRTCFGGRQPCSGSNSWNVYDLKPNEDCTLITYYILHTLRMCKIFGFTSKKNIILHGINDINIYNVILGRSLPSLSTHNEFLRSAFFWDITQRRVVTVLRHFGTKYRSRLQRSKSPRRKDLDFLTLEDGTDTFFWNVGKQLQLDAP